MKRTAKILSFQQKQDFTPAMDKATRWNFNALLFDGSFFSIGAAFLEANTLFPAFVSLLTRNSVLIGLVSSIRNAGYLLPQLLVAGYAERLPYKKPLLKINGLVNRLSVLAMAAVAYFLAGTNPSLALIGIFAAITIFSLTDGIGGVPWTDMVAKTIPNTRRGRLFGTMQALGGAGAFAAGFVIRQILASSRLPFPVNYTVLMLIGCVFMCFSYAGTMSVREPAGFVRKGSTIRTYLKRLPGVWKGNKLFQRMMFTRMLLSFLYLSLPFYVVFARDVLKFPDSTIGIFISAQMAGSILSGLLWGYVGDKHGNRLVIRLASLAALMTPGLALTASLMTHTGLDSLAILPYLLLFASIGSTLSGMWLGFTNYLLELVDDSNRPTYIGMMNTLIAPFTFLPLLGGVLVQFLSHEVLFAATMVMLLAGNVLAKALPEPRALTEREEEQEQMC